MMGEDEGDEVWMKHLIRCGFTEDQAASIMALACDLTTWTHHGGTAHSFALLKEAHSNTWFSIERLKCCVVFFQGVAAGSSLADAVFRVGASLCFGLIDKNVSKAGVGTYLDAVGASEFWDCDISRREESQHHKYRMPMMVLSQA